mgnify:CR=1 FL=1
MVKVIGVRFRTAGKIYFFSPGQFDIKQGDNVIDGNCPRRRVRASCKRSKKKLPKKM